MHVTINRRFKSGVPLVRSDEHYVDCDIEYSDGERKIIESRDLFDHTLLAGSDDWPESGNSPRNLKMGSIFAFVIAVILLISWLAGASYSGAIRHIILLFVGAIGFWVWGTYADHEGIDAGERVTAGMFLGEPHLSICAKSEAQADQVEAELRAGIERLKAAMSHPARQHGG